MKVVIGFPGWMVSDAAREIDVVALALEKQGAGKGESRESESRNSFTCHDTRPGDNKDRCVPLLMEETSRSSPSLCRSPPIRSPSPSQAAMDDDAAAAAAMAELTIYNLPPSPPNWDRVGVFYISFCATWTFLVACGMLFCLLNRDSPVMRIRGIALSFGSIVFLHMYWIMAQITYPIGMTMPIVIAYDVQYFVMGIWFPLGVALFHASNSRFLHVAKLQKQFTRPEQRSKAGCDGGKSSWLCRLRNMDYTKRILIFVGVGIIAQILLTAGMWVACKKYHPTFGIPGTEIKGDTLEEQIVDLGRGWEWWPSVLWQVIWTWIIAPVMIWRAWGIRDTMGWRFQTVGCCLASLHATPMFLVASYVDAFAPINPYFPPSQWIHLSTMIFEIFAVFVPIYHIIKLRLMRRRTADSSAKWETASQTSTLTPSTLAPSTGHDGKFTLTSATAAEKGQAFESFEDESDDRLLTMSALEHVLRSNPAQLQEFSALCDFSGENVAFLSRAASFREACPRVDRQDAFNRALGIYADFISPRDAAFPLNLPSADLKQLEHVFEKSARAVLGDAPDNLATPFDGNPFDAAAAAPPAVPPASWAAGSDAEMRFDGEVPNAFDATIFDKALAHVKYLVLTNTWPKFVAHMQRRQSAETERSDFTAASDTTLASRVSSTVSSVSSKVSSMFRRLMK